MGLAKRTTQVLLVAAAIALWSPPSAFTQEPRAGVVTTVEGRATVARLTLPQPQPLRFRDDIFLHDRITTGDRSIVRVLLGGKATVTARERSILTITELPGVSTVELSSGRISVAVSKALMKPGEVVEIRTPNAVAGIRGTVVVAEVSPSKSGITSTITVLRGLIDVTRLDAVARRTVGLSVDVGALQSVTVTGSAPVSSPTAITPDAAEHLRSEFRVVPSDAPAASLEPAVQEAMQRAAQDATALLLPSDGTNSGASANTGSSSTVSSTGGDSGSTRDDSSSSGNSSSGSTSSASTSSGGTSSGASSENSGGNSNGNNGGGHGNSGGNGNGNNAGGNSNSASNSNAGGNGNSTSNAGGNGNGAANSNAGGNGNGNGGGNARGNSGVSISGGGNAVSSNAGGNGNGGNKPGGVGGGHVATTNGSTPGVSNAGGNGGGRISGGGVGSGASASPGNAQNQGGKK